MKEHVCKTYPNKGLVFRIDKETELSNKMTNKPILKWSKDWNRHFSKGKQMANKHMKRCSTS